jgi:hypothetical protein
MSKPIFVVRIPKRDFLGEVEMFDKLRRDLKKELTDYHVLITADSNTGKSEFECYNADDATEASLQEIQDKIFSILEENESRQKREDELKQMIYDDEESGLYEEDETNNSI